MYRCIGVHFKVIIRVGLKSKGIASVKLFELEYFPSNNHSEKIIIFNQRNSFSFEKKNGKRNN